MARSMPPIRTRVRTVLALAAVAVVAGCGRPSDQTAASPPTAPDAASTAAQGQDDPGRTPTTTNPGVDGTPPGGAAPRCHTAQLAAHLGARAAASPGQGAGQTAIPLVYTNTSTTGCLLRGVPGLDLHGPADPNGPVYQLPRQDRGGPGVTLAPGASASARVVVLSYEQGSVGSAGSTRWTPTQLVTIPPGETTPLTVAWPAGLTVLRQDEATRPGSWVESFAAG